MVSIRAAEQLNLVLSNSDATYSRAGISIHVDDSVIERIGKKIRCTYKWYSGRFKQVVTGNDLLSNCAVLQRPNPAVTLKVRSKAEHTSKPELLVQLYDML